MKVLRETEVSPAFDGGNNVGMLALFHAAQATIKKTATHGIALVSVTDAWMSGSACWRQSPKCSRVANRPYPEKAWRAGAREDVSLIGQGTWYIEQADGRAAVAAVRRGLDLGMNHIDTAEMYGDGAAEEWWPRPPPAAVTRCSSSPRCCPTTPRSAAPSPPASVRCGAFAPTGSTATSFTGVGRIRWPRPSSRSTSCSEDTLVGCQQFRRRPSRRDRTSPAPGAWPATREAQ